ncbi:hypothetical protein [Rufibacter hautae]|nr:hypothetical protein [Rufibacter hautae]
MGTSAGNGKLSVPLASLSVLGLKNELDKSVASNDYLMKIKLLAFVSVLFLLGCSGGIDSSIQMTSFKVVNQKSFEMCFTREVEGIYSMVIKTKQGKEIKKAGRLVGGGRKCFTELKMQHAASAYNTAQTSFYTDTLVTENIASIKWNISRRYYEEPFAEGEFLNK